MKRYADASSLRKALEERLKRRHIETAVDLDRLRRRATYERLVSRLAADDSTGWILKGGTALEFRLLDRARATKDIDLAVPMERPGASRVHELLEACLTEDPDGDWFTFTVKEPTQLCVPDLDGNGWNVRIDASLAGRRFANVRLDVVARGDEVMGTEVLALPGMLSFAGIATREVCAVDRRQHFAEKMHALTRDRGGRENTRVKDLVDMVLLIENGLAADRELVTTVRHVFSGHGVQPFPSDIPDPPEAWRTEYPRMAATLTEAEADMAVALELVRAFWDQALSDESSG